MIGDEDKRAKRSGIYAAARKRATEEMIVFRLAHYCGCGHHRDVHESARCTAQRCRCAGFTRRTE